LNRAAATHAPFSRSATMFRVVATKSATTIVSEWDALAQLRHRQITSGEDISYLHILVPNVLALMLGEAPRTALDVGCGSGFLTNLIAERVSKVVGIDPSAENIAIARTHHANRADFVRETLETYSKRVASTFDVAIANMVLMDVIDLDAFLAAARSVLQPGGALIFSITHPWFWPSYSGYARETWFRYDRELIIESPFTISARRDCPLLSTHVHRPLKAYVAAFRRTSLVIEGLHEPMPSEDVAALYPDAWEYPRFLVGICRR
jgi:2-polyprenyl-3-methyl-5-hydroxy-6-metoxy-1,4-benzoquinol methylase